MGGIQEKQKYILNKIQPKANCVK